MNAHEVNFDGLVGPTHNYAGLSFGNVASMTHRAQYSNPREAARQGLAKMKALSDLGLKQAVLPPHARPDLGVLRTLGFTGDAATTLARALKEAPEILAACASASSMWTANAATVSPSADTADGRVHFTPANLVAKFHRSIEFDTTGRVLRAIFNDQTRFAHHPALPANPTFGDEGAANHTRLGGAYGAPGIDFFVYGRHALGGGATEPKHFPARQTLEASRAVARRHGLAPEACVFAQQDPAAIDAGAFHNDVVSVGNQHVLFYHERAFIESESLVTALSRLVGARAGRAFVPIMVREDQVSLGDAVRSYLFNSQLITLPSGEMSLVAPRECLENDRVRDFVEGMTSGGGPVTSVRHFDLRQSMNNGGGPACLRLRVVLNDAELAATNPKVLMSEDLYRTLMTWVEKHYRERLTTADLADPALHREGETALDELTQIMGLGSVYPFQRGATESRSPAQV